MVRYFSGGREKADGKSIAATIMRLEFEKKGKLDSTERFKLIMKMKMDAAKKEHAQKKGSSRAMSAKAEKALKDMAAKKAAKQTKAMRHMVIVTPQRYNNGTLNKKGVIYDIAGNVIGKVNKKNGKIVTNLGGSLGLYKPKNQFVHTVITNAINQYSPYFINLRKMQAMQAAGLDPVTGQPINQEAINVHGHMNSQMAMHGGGYIPPSERQEFGGHSTGNSPGDTISFDSTYGETPTGPRQNVTATAWGAMSDNVWGTFADNVWGTSADTVWGTNTSDVWGGIGGNPYGAAPKTIQVWGTGSGKNFMLVVTNAIRKLFGVPIKANVTALRAYRQGAGSTSSRTSSVSRSGTDHGQTRSTRSGSSQTTRSATPTTRSGK